MSTTLDREALETALRKSGAAWIFEYWAEAADQHLGNLCQDLDEFVEEYERRFHERPDPLRLLERNPAKGIAFFQIDTFRVSLEMKVMIWRILMGCEVVRVDFSYQMGSSIGLTVVLKTPYGLEDPPYRATSNEDFRVLRHLGAMGRPGGLVELQGYFALKSPA